VLDNACIKAWLLETTKVLTCLGNSDLLFFIQINIIPVVLKKIINVD
jgi:hypothetical protein